MVDEESAKRAIKILNAGIGIQNIMLNKEVKGLDILYLTKEEADKTLQRIIIRMKDNTGTFGGGRRIYLVHNNLTFEVEGKEDAGRDASITAGNVGGKDRRDHREGRFKE